MSTMNRLYNVTNPAQGKAKKVLCLCSAGLLRSPTAAWVLSNEPYNYNTRAAGITPEYALIPLDEVLVAWADEILCVHEHIYDGLAAWAAVHGVALKGKRLPVLHIPDLYERRAPKLVALIEEQYKEYLEIQP